MTAVTGGVPPMHDVYEANAEYYDTITRTRVAELDHILVDLAAHVDPQGPPLLDIGAATGRLTARLARLVAPCEIIAIEPTRSLRSVLASRVADDDQLITQVTILPRTLDDASDSLPAAIGGGIAFGVLPHLDPRGRRGLLRAIADRLIPHGRVLVEVMRPWTIDPVPTTPGEEATVGRHRVECSMRAEPAGRDQLIWSMTYRRIDERGVVLHDATADSLCWVVDPATFESEAREAGLDVAWPTAEIAELCIGNPA